MAHLTGLAYLIIMLIIMTHTEIRALEQKMTDHLLKNLAAPQDRRAKLHAARTEAIQRRDWAAMDEITRRIAKLEAK